MPAPYFMCPQPTCHGQHLPSVKDLCPSDPFVQGLTMPERCLVCEEAEVSVEGSLAQWTQTILGLNPGPASYELAS